MNRPTPPSPSFLIIGAQKSGTRWLRLNLGRHPEIFTAGGELSFFNTRAYRRGLDRYREEFDGWAGEPIVGEATPGYMLWRCEPDLVSKRIAGDLPDVRLLALLRNPVDRLYSAFVHHVRRGRIDPNEEIRELAAAVPPEADPLQLVAGGWYARSLEPFVGRFGDRLLVLLHDQVSIRPEEVFRTALEHIGGDPSFVPANLREVVFSRVLPQGTRYWVPGTGRRDLTSEERADLLTHYGEEIDRLERMTGLDLGGWRDT